jgi:hypothetical protein
VISKLASKRYFKNFNHGGDIRKATRWCVALDCVSYSSCYGLPLSLCFATWLADSVPSKFEPAKSSSISSVRTFQSLFNDRDLRDPLPLIANRGQSLFSDRDLHGPLPLIANRGQYLFTDRDLRGLRTLRPAALATRAHAAPTAQPAQPCGVVIFPFVQTACSTSRRTTWRTASRPMITKHCPSSSP